MRQHASVRSLAGILAACVGLLGCPTPPTADFSATPTTAPAPLSVAFTDTSSPGSAAITAWTWNFGDGHASAAQNPEHFYATAGTYTVSLTVTSSVGSDTETKADYVNVELRVQYTLTTSVVNGHGTLAPATGSQTANAVVFLIATPATGYRVKKWTGTDNDISTATTNRVTMTSAKTVTVEFEVITYLMLTTAVVNGHGTLTPATGLQAANTVVTLTATPGTGYRVKKWTGTNNDTITAATNQVTMASAKTVTVEFELITYVLTTSVANGHGMLTPATGPQTANTVVGLTATPDTGYRVKKWTGTDNDNSTATTNKVTMTMAKAVTVEFEGERIWYVVSGGSGTGKSWSEAFGAIQDAVDAASEAGGGDVWVTAGTYTTSTTDNVVVMKSHVRLYGGFAGTETTRNERDWEINKTIIDGEGARRCVHGADDAALDGLVIQNGDASGGGMYNYSSSPTVTNCTFTGNTASYSGGGMYNSSSSSPTVTNCTFSGNTAGEYGGGMYNSYSSPTVTNCMFTGNTASYSGGGMHNTSSSPTVKNCTFTGNTAGDTAGDYGGGGICNISSSPTVTNCILWGDSASSGSEMYNFDLSSPTVTYSCVEGGYNGEGNIVDDPQLVAGPSGNGRIRPESKCVDAGKDDMAPSTDIRGVARPQGNHVDMGAYELDDTGDGDGMSDTWEMEHLGDLTALPGDDADADGLTNLEESLYGADPNAVDFDGDGLTDGDEVREGWNPTIPTPVRRVNVNRANPSGNQDGLSWATAFDAIQEAVDDLPSTAKEAMVWVAAGTYTTSTGDTVVVMRQSHVHLYGGFAGTETTRDNRNWRTNETIIDGEGVRRCVYVYEAHDATLDGFTLWKGYASSGGGMYNSSSSPTVTNCTFTGNVASDYGGGMYNNDSSSPTVAKCTFTENTASKGGGMCNYDYSSPTVANCMFAENTASDDGGGMYNNYYCSPTVTNCTFTQNAASDYGGGMYSDHSSTPRVTNCILWGDSASSGSEIYNSNLSLPSVTYSCVEGGYSGAGNISSDPLLVAGPSGKARIWPDSQCIDAGTSDGAPSTDIRGVARPQGIRVDMGAYELDDTGDRDDMSDTWEIEHFGDLAAQPGDDADADGLTNLEESLYGADPNAVDSDGDGLTDGDEVREGWNPTIPTPVRRVNVNRANPSGNQDGLSWETAFVSIQDAVDAASDAVDELQSAEEAMVWVAAGTYAALPTDNVVVMNSHVHLYGGFAARETKRDDRDWKTNETIIDGGGARRCVYVYEAHDATLNGFVIQNGHIGGPGGGMYNAFSSLTVANCTFTGNTVDGFGTGGGMCNLYSSPTVTNCTFTGNAAANVGGGMENYASSPTVMNCTFIGNSAEGGGGMENSWSSSPTVTNCTFSENTVDYDGGGISSGENCLPTVTNCILWNDSASSNGNEIRNSDSTSTSVVTYSCVEGGYDGTGNISSDPLFVDSANGDYSLQSGSPCIDKGTSEGAPDTDIEGTERPQGSGYDMGAYEYAAGR